MRDPTGKQSEDEVVQDGFGAEARFRRSEHLSRIVREADLHLRPILPCMPQEGVEPASMPGAAKPWSRARWRKDAEGSQCSMDLARHEGGDEHVGVQPQVHDTRPNTFSSVQTLWAWALAVTR
jgi:hypothetical protein